MAKLSSHEQVGKDLEYLLVIKKICEDRKVLINSGFGWKVGSVLNKNVSPEEAYTILSEGLNSFNSRHPAYCAYKDLLHKQAMKFYGRIDNDLKDYAPDSEALFNHYQEYSWSSSEPHLTLKECQDLMNAYKAYRNELAIEKGINPPFHYKKYSDD